MTDMTKESINDLRLFECHCDLKFHDIDYPWQCICGNLKCSFFLCISFILEKLCIICETMYVDNDFLIDFLYAHSI